MVSVNVKHHVSDAITWWSIWRVTRDDASNDVIKDDWPDGCLQMTPIMTLSQGDLSGSCLVMTPGLTPSTRWRRGVCEWRRREKIYWHNPLTLVFQVLVCQTFLTSTIQCNDTNLQKFATFIYHHSSLLPKQNTEYGYICRPHEHT